MAQSGFRIEERAVCFGGSVPIALWNQQGCAPVSFANYVAVARLGFITVKLSADCFHDADRSYDLLGIYARRTFYFLLCSSDIYRKCTERIKPQQSKLPRGCAFALPRCGLLPHILLEQSSWWSVKCNYPGASSYEVDYSVRVLRLTAPRKPQ